jgi:hypothetical protein
MPATRLTARSVPPLGRRSRMKSSQTATVSASTTGMAMKSSRFHGWLSASSCM